MLTVNLHLVVGEQQVVEGLVDSATLVRSASFPRPGNVWLMLNMFWAWL
jgi:hypothetical protein